MPTIKVTIDRRGIPTLTPEGFVGDACVVATKDLEDLLSAGSEVNRTLTDAYYDNDGGKTEVEAESC